MDSPYKGRLKIEDVEGYRNGQPLPTTMRLVWIGTGPPPQRIDGSRFDCDDGVARCFVGVLGCPGRDNPRLVLLYTAKTDTALCVTDRYFSLRVTDDSDDWMVHSIQHCAAAADRSGIDNSRQLLSSRFRRLLPTMALSQRKDPPPLLANRILDNLCLDMVPHILSRLT
jgi:hypothetical protein